jgi:putative ABC transport system permease protein
MRAINRKLVRDLAGMKGQALAICSVIACGVATFVMSLTTLDSLERTRTTYYERFRFAHVFAHLKRAPLALASRIADIPGVARVETRIAVDVNLDVEGMAEPGVGHLVSIPERDAPTLNDVYLRQGRYIEPGRAGEVLVGESFAEAHSLAPGDTVLAVINGRREKLHIVGVALSPEYVLQIRGGELLPDTRRFGVFWMGYEQLAGAFDMDGAFNDVTLALMRGASEPEVLKRLDDLTEPYGGIGSYGRDNQLSHRYLSDEIRQLKSMGLIAPSIFLSVAAFLLNVVLNRVISVQREQIAALKAFGYTKFEVGLHYLTLAVLIALVGGVVGSGFGIWMGHGLAKMYTRFYKFPLFDYRPDLSVLLLALGISIGAAVVGTLAAVRRAVRLPPAEAMRPEPPASFKPTILERSGFQALLSQASRMILRQMERRPLKALLSCFGIALAVAVLILGSFGKDSLDYIIDIQFYLAQRQDMQVTFVEPTTAEAYYEVGRLPGVLRAEAFRVAPTRMRFGHRSRRVGLMGLEPEARLFRLIDAEEKTVALPDEGLLLSTKLAELLDVRVGERVTVEVLEGERPVREVPVTGLVTEFGGTNAYMNVDALRRLMREGESLSGAFLAVDARFEDQLYKTLKETPRVASVTVKRAAIQAFYDTIAENMLRMRFFNILFAGIIAFGVVYNSARISLAERSRELATLRVIGFTRAEISAILLGELAVLTVAAIPLGMVMGYGFAALAALGLDTELYRIPLVVEPPTFAFAAVVVLIAAIFSGLVVRRKLDHLDLVAVLKSKE